jgi:hypothetical protein
MASILSLPEELLIEIVSPFERDRLCLRNLSLVSRRLHATARPFLFRHVGIVTNHGSGHEPPIDEPGWVVQARLLERSFSEHSRLRELVWTYGPVFLKRHHVGRKILPFCTDLTDQKGHWEPTFHATRESLALIEGFPNLKELWLSCADTESKVEASEYTESVFEIPYASKLSSMKIEGGGVEMLSCMGLGNIRELVTTNFHLPWGEMPSRFQHKSTSLRRLEIVGHECAVPLTHFTRLMLMCPQLEELKVHGKLNVRFWGYPPPEYTFHTEGVLDALNQVRTSLKSLELIIPPRGIIEANEDPLDLSQFDGLVHLRISGMYFFPFEEIPSRKDLNRLLPRNIESFQIDFPPQAGFARNFWSHNNDEIQYDPNTDTVSLLPEQFDWISQFTTLKKERFPHLSDLALLDDEFRDAKGPGRCMVKCKLPEEVETTFAAAGIELNVRILLWDGHPGLKKRA